MTTDRAEGMTPALDTAEGRRLLESATPGPWEVTYETRAIQEVCTIHCVEPMPDGEGGRVILRPHHRSFGLGWIAMGVEADGLQRHECQDNRDDQGSAPLSSVHRSRPSWRIAKLPIAMSPHAQMGMRVHTLPLLVS